MSTPWRDDGQISVGQLREAMRGEVIAPWCGAPLAAFGAMGDGAARGLRVELGRHGPRASRPSRIAAAPLFVAQPLALIVLGARLRNNRPLLAGALLAAGVVTGTAAVSFVLSGDGPASGVLERLALWPVLVGLAGFAWTRLAPMVV